MVCALIRTARCTRAVGKIWPSLGALALVSCAHHAYSWPPSYIRQTEFPDHYEMLVLGTEYWGEPLLAAGDSLRMQVRHDVCHVDVCAGDVNALGQIEWTAGPATYASITNDGWLRALRAGDVWVRARHGDTVLTRDVRVLPPVARLAWTDIPAVVRIGDTLNLRVAAFDSSGQRVAYLPNSAVAQLYRGAATSRAPAIELVGMQAPNVTRVHVVRSGTVLWVARLAHRLDTLDLRVTQ
jgi:hypothetical protein